MSAFETISVVLLPLLVFAIVGNLIAGKSKFCSKCGQRMHRVFVELSNGKPSYDYTCKGCGYQVKYFPFPFPHGESTFSFKISFWAVHPILLTTWAYRSFRWEVRHPHAKLYRFYKHRKYGFLWSVHHISLPRFKFGFYFNYSFNWLISYLLVGAFRMVSFQTNGFFPTFAFSSDNIKKLLEEKHCYCGTPVREPKYAYENLVFCSQRHKEYFMSSRVDPLCGLILPQDPLQGISVKQNITTDRGIIVARKKYVFCSTEHRDIYAKRNGLPLNLPEADLNRRSMIQKAGILGAGLVAAFTLGRVSVLSSAQSTPSSLGADPSFGANGVGLPSLTNDPSPLPPVGTLWYRSDLSVVRVNSNGTAISLGVRPFISISPNGPDSHGDYGPNTPSTTTSGFQEAINFLSTNGTNTNYSQGGILEIFPGAYTSNGAWQLPSSTSTAFDLTFQGAGKSNTSITISPSSTVAGAIVSGYTTWIKGLFGPQLNFKDLGFAIGGTYTGSNKSSGSFTNSAIVDLEFYSVFMDTVEWEWSGASFSSGSGDLFKAGSYAGPSQPCVWKACYFTGSCPNATIIDIWWEGFTWRGGLVDNTGAANAGVLGINWNGGGGSYFGQIDSYDNSTGGGLTGVWRGFISCGHAPTILETLEYPFLSNISLGGSQPNTYLSGTVSGYNVTIIGFENESAVNYGNANGNFLFFYDPTADNHYTHIKTVGFSLGLQSYPLSNPSNVSGQQQIGMNGYTNVKSPTASTDYRANTDFLISVSGGTGVSISILDDYGNNIATGLGSLATFRMSPGMHINFGAFTSAPAVSVWQLGS